ncbi:heparinase II/III family protein [Pseudarthrobacter chlorophenolicus A6]|uniref:Heparinase II/III family protein n=1 Tax=Pseudarthrobacter chlorophenolicus (strain ATCC 700700 / DSM 12829 / CIP 107037 / JCM 12360 / KCTC 9906 / NCIMB 13794 / A6) TaxID=452863 RepID=B8H6J4_PSECP|nr:heparinase II/III family protein [Pseudarthrobacter chlorophenolicus]ACL41520.1 heparinase II/III family protein [Pseudarthrobacter chlorophenolicus A6]
MDIPAAGSAAWPAEGLHVPGPVARQAQEERGTPWPQPLVSHYARYFRDGNRTAYEGLVAARQQRLTRAVVMALASGPGSPGADGVDAEAWLDEVIDGAFLLCEQSSWSWAAHDDVFRRTGCVVPDLATPYLDLGAGEVAAQLAWLDHVLGLQLDDRAPGLRRRIREEVAGRVIRPFLDRLDWHWLGLDGDVHNWNPWIHSNLIAAALFLVDDPDTRAHTVARCIEGLDRFLASIPADGAIDEGFAYWWNGAGRALEGLALLEQATGGVLDGGLPVVRELVAFPHRMHIGGAWFLNVADGPARAAAALPWDMLHRWAARLGDPEAAAHAAAMATGAPDPAAGLGRVLHALLEHPEPASNALPLVAATYLPSVQIMVARETAGTVQGLFLAAKGGHNGEHHNHRDVGSVVVAVDGVPLLVDAGQPTYTAQTFGPDRYGIRAMQSKWHSVPAPFGLEQGTGRDFAAGVLNAPTPERPQLELALGAAYGFEPLAWIRTAELRRAPGRITIADRWDLPAPGAGGTSDIDITFLTAGTLVPGPDGTATVRPDGIPAVGAANATPRGAALRWDPAAVVVLVDEWELDDPLLADAWGPRLTRLRFRTTAPAAPSPAFRAAGAFTLTVEATP